MTDPFSPKRRLGLSVIALSLATTACATAPPSAPDGRAVPTFADLHRIKIAEIGERLEVPIADGSISAKSELAIAEFAALYRAYGRGPLTISAPAGANPQFADATRAALADNGVLFEAVAVTSYEAAAPDAALVLSFSRFTAEAPDCPPVYAENIAASHSNTPTKSFGCATQANLAAMIADPGDLVSPRASDPADATRRAIVLDRYRSGTQTHATRSEDERVTVSRVAR